MNNPTLCILLLLVAISLGAGGYYEYNRQNEEILARQQAIPLLIKTVSQLQANADDLQTGNKSLTKELADVQGKVSDLTSQIAAAKSNLDQMKSATEEFKKTTDEATMAADKAKRATDAILHPPPPTNNLGTIVTRNGKTYDTCGLLKVEANDIIIHSSTGVISIFYTFLPANLQSKFGYNPMKPGDLAASQVKFEEKIRIEAGD
jgi:cell division protein FtsB